MDKQSFIALCVVMALFYLFVILPLPARIARKKGHSYAFFLVFAIIWFPGAVTLALLIKNKQISNDNIETSNKN